MVIVQAKKRKMTQDKISKESYGQASGETFSLIVEPNCGPPFLYWIRNSIGYPFSLWGTMPRSLNVKAANSTNRKCRTQDSERELQNKVLPWNNESKTLWLSKELTIFWNNCICSISRNLIQIEHLRLG